MKDKLSLDEIKGIVEFLEEHDVYEFSLERGSEKLHLKRGKNNNQLTTQVVGVPAPQVVASSPAVVVPQAEQAAPAEASRPAAEEKNVHEIKCPMVGTFYSRPSPDQPQFVEVGQKVSKGDVLCIVEAMKVMNEIECDTSGVISKVCLEDGHVAEYDEVLFHIEAGS